MFVVESRSFLRIFAKLERAQQYARWIKEKKGQTAHIYDGEKSYGY